MDKNDDNIIDIGKAFTFVWQKKIPVIIVTAVFTLFGFLLSSFIIRPTYSASADMLVTNTKASVSETITINDINAASDLVDTYSVILKSHTLLDQVIQELSLTTSYEQLSKDINVSSVNKTQVMHITVDAASSDNALRIVQKVVELAPTAIENAISSGSVKTVDQPWTSGKPVSPSVPKDTLLFAFCGLALSVIVVLVREFTNNKFKTEKDVQSVLNLPVLGIIPFEDDNQSTNRFLMKEAVRR